MDWSGSSIQRSSRKGSSRSRFYRDLASPVKIDFSSHPQQSSFLSSWPDGPPPPPILSLHEQAEDISPAAHDFKTPPRTTKTSSPFISFRNETPPDAAEGGPFGRGLSSHTPVDSSRRSPLFKEGDKENESPVNVDDSSHQESRGLLALPPLEEAEPPDNESNGSADGHGWVTVFGFTPKNTNLVLREFEKCGTILKHVLGPEGANFVHILYQNPYDVQKALQKNGVQISSSLMIGVKPMDPLQCRAFTEKSKTAFMVLPPRSPRKVASSTSATKASSRPYYMQQPNEKGLRFSGAIASPSKSTISRVVDLIFGI